MTNDALSQQVIQLVSKVDNLSEDVRTTNTQMKLVCANMKAVGTTVDRLYDEMHLPGVALTDTVAARSARLNSTEQTLLHHVEVCEKDRRRINNQKWQLTIAILVAALALVGSLVTVLTPIVMAKGTP